MATILSMGTVSVNGTYGLDEENKAKWEEWYRETIRHADQRTAYLEGLAFLWSHISFRALVIGSVLFNGDEWEPISKDGMLPYASQWVADLIVDYRKMDARDRKIVLLTEYSDIGKRGWWIRDHGSIWYFPDNGIMEMKTPVSWPRS